MTTRKDIVNAIRSYRYAIQDEMEFHRALEAVFEAEGISYLHEHDLGRSGISDFFCDGVCLEVKVDGSAAAVLRQLFQYAESKEVRELILVTTKSKHGTMPSQIIGKPLTTVVISVGLS